MKKNISLLLFFFPLFLFGASPSDKQKTLSQSSATEWGAPADVTPEQVENVIKKTKEAGKMVYDFLNLNYVSDLPAVVHKDIQGVSYDIALNKLEFAPGGNTISVYAMITTQDNQRICFAGESIVFTGSGGIQEGELKILLGGDSQIKLLKLEKIALNLTGGSLKFGCDGYESFSIQGNLVFSRDLIVPENTQTGEVIGGNVTSSFKLDKVRSWNDLMFEINLPTFQIPKMEGYSFTVQNAVFDISDALNSPATAFPVGYTSAEMGPQWHGVYIGEVSVRFPETFKNRATNQRLKVGVKRLLIDGIGVSGEVFGENIMALKEGDLNGWDYSVDYAGIEIVKNSVRSGRLAGKMRVAVAEEEHPFGYRAVIDPGRDYYEFMVSSEDKLEFPFLKAANVSLAPTSAVSLKLQNKKFSASANLHGTLDITAADDGLSLQSYTFENLYVSTAAPYLSIGSFGGGSDKEQKFGNFPVSLIAPNILIQNSAAFVKFGLKVNLDNVGISATGGFVIEGEFVTTDNRHFWKHKRLGVETLYVKGDFKAAKIRGAIAYFKNDPIYGKGFGGYLDMTLGIHKQIDFSVSGMFGRKDDKPYWFLDGEYSGAGEGSTGLAIHLLAGGFYKHMSASNRPGTFKTSTGVGYVPDFSVNWGAKFGVGFGVGGGSAISGMAGMEVVTREDGSLSKIGLMGKVAVAGSPSNHSAVAVREAYIAMTSTFSGFGGLASQTDGEPEAVSGAVNSFIPADGANQVGFSAFCVLNLDFQNNTYYGKAGANVSMSAITIQAVAAFLFGPDKWFLHFGEPPMNSRIIVSIPAFPAIDAYIMLGHGVVDLPDPQPNIFDKFPGERAGYSTGINPSTISLGQGISFGAGIGVSATGDFKVVSFSLGARAGVDIMLTRYADGVYCVGREGQGIGINNWRAGGQMYAIGWFKAQAFGVSVLDISLGAMLAAKAPNPTFAVGKVQVNFKVLFKSFKFKVGFTVGEDCELAQSEGTETITEVIESNYPHDSAGYIPSDSPVYFTFTDPINKEISIDGMEGKYLIKVVDFSVRDESGNPTEGSYSNQGDKKVGFNPAGGFLPADQKLTASVKIQVLTNGQPMIADGKPLEQFKEFSFTTAKSAQQHVQELDQVKEDIHEQAETIKDETQQEAEAINREAEDRARDIRQKSEEALKEIEEKNIERANEIKNLAENSAPEIQTKVDSVVTEALDKANEVVDDSKDKIQKILDDALAKVRRVTTTALTNVTIAVTAAEIRGINYITAAQQQIVAMARAHEAALRDLERERKRKVFLKVFKKGKDKVREEYRIIAEQMRQQYANAIAAVRAEAERKAQAEMDEARAEKERIMAAARAKCKEIMDKAENDCSAVIADAAAQCKAIMDEAERICRDIIGLPQIDMSGLNTYTQVALDIRYNESDEDEGGEGLDEDAFEQAQKEAEEKRQQEQAQQEEERRQRESEEFRRNEEQQQKQQEIEDQRRRDEEQRARDEEERRRQEQDEYYRNQELERRRVQEAEEEWQRQQEAMRLENIRQENERAEQLRQEQYRQEMQRQEEERNRQVEFDRRRQLEYERQQMEQSAAAVYNPPVITRDYVYYVVIVNDTEMMF